MNAMWRPSRETVGWYASWMTSGRAAVRVLGFSSVTHAAKSPLLLLGLRANQGREYTASDESECAKALTRNAF
jgi:hypothetical protein